MTTAKDFFDRVRDASVDAERCRLQLLELEGRMHSMGAHDLQPRVRSTPDPQRMAGRVGAYVDREESLRERQQQDYALIDAACTVLYGSDERRGLGDVVSPIWADILWWRYLDASTWEDVGHAVSYSVRQCQTMCDAAFSWIDSNRFASDIIS